MPQDSLRSVVYRSLVPCSDPNGIVEYDTMKKSNSGGSRKKESKIIDKKRSSVLKDLMSEETEVESSPFQVLEVSRGAQKLNLMIDSWSKGVSFDGESKDIARDLLKGALDLQESLVMLYNLQEASHSLGQKTKNYDGGGSVGRSHSDRFMEKHVEELQHRRLSFDGSSRTSAVEELKKVIRDSLTRQNLLSEEQGASFGSRKFSDFSDNPSTSSSQSSMVHSNNSTSGRWSVSEKSKDTKAKSPSVIAKLMGIEGYPSEASSIEPSVVKKDVNSQMQGTQRRNEGPGRKTLKEVLETMHHKGFLKDEDSEGHEVPDHPSCSNSHSNHWLDEEMPPIVVIKPVGFSHDSGLSNSSPESRGESSNDGLYQAEDKREPKATHKVDPPTRIVPQNKKPINLKEIPHKVETKATLIRRRVQEEGSSDSKQIRRKQEEKGRIVREQVSSNKASLVSLPPKCKPQEKGSENKTINRVKKVVPSKIMVKEPENVKRSTMSRSADEVRATSTKGRKSVSAPITTKNHTQRQEITTQGSALIRPIHSRPQNGFGQVKNNVTRKAKPVKESPPTSSVIQKTKGKNINKQINSTDKLEYVSTIANRNLEEQLTEMEATEASKLPIEEHGAESSQERSSIESAEELKQMEKAKNETNLKNLLLSSPSFLTSAADLFQLQMKQHTVIPKTTSTEDVTTINTRHFLDCANELIEYRSHRLSLYGYPLFWIEAINQTTTISLEQLLAEVCDDIEKLKNYSNVESDGIYNMLERDIKCKRVVAGGAWDLGWEFGFSANDGDQVVGELQEHVLNDLVEEIIVDYTKIMVQNLYF